MGGAGGVAWLTGVGAGVAGARLRCRAANVVEAAGVRGAIEEGEGVTQAEAQPARGIIPKIATSRQWIVYSRGERIAVFTRQV